ncbi:MAG: VWA domain-containing protein [Candidatus Eremiobacterota bacterium]
MFRFATPWALALLPLLAALAWSGLRTRRQTQAALAYSSLGLLGKSRAVRPKWESHLPWALTALGMLLICLSLARPQFGTSREVVKHSGVDIMLVLDTSTSMQAPDLLPNRLEAAKLISREFAEARPSDRIGLVVFAGTAFSQCPLTTDHGTLSQLLQGVRFAMGGVDGTAIGTALASAVNRLKDLPGKSRIIILLTDGCNTAGEIDPMMAAKLAAEFKIKVYTIGIGSAQPLAQDPMGFPTMLLGAAEIDVETMTKIAQETGGKFFQATDNRSLEKIYEEIDRLEKVDRKTEIHTDYRELFAIPLAAGLALVALSALLEFTWLREVP